ncbi:carcinoembryonic antigen-related cell adhesion molecule 5-like [Eublepharis macularius]|uniref:Carcinoembryonic antigen-related cell adhesion molecule 5-like n=1 Tax=Eublepharis macularius TaxID=481883 RepID=A0AA97KGH6_EUBMA|nr:carcinoembryonic antigen-related cell adhesion molecule 5-like [Eublepharis macularius]
MAFDGPIGWDPRYLLPPSPSRPPELPPPTTAASFNRPVVAVLTCSSQIVLALGQDSREILPKPSVMPSHALVLVGETLALTCLSQDNSTSIQWLKDNHYLPPNNKLHLSDGNRTLLRKGVTKADAGAYQCEVRNSVSFRTSDAANVSVAYGPDAVEISPSGNITQPFGSPLILTCSADSVPVPQFGWLFNSTSVGQNSSRLTVNSTMWENEGIYECWVYNTLINRTGWASVTVIVTDQESPSAHPGLSLRLISGSIFGLLTVVVLIVAPLYCLCARVWREKSSQVTSTTALCDNRPPGLHVRPGPKPENSPDPSSTYQALQYGDEALYQELGK